MADEKDFLNDWAADDNSGADDGSVDTGNGTDTDLDNGASGGDGSATVDNGATGNGGNDPAATAGDNPDEGHDVPYAAMKAERAKRQAERERAEKSEARQRELESQIEALRNPTSARAAQPADSSATATAEVPDFWVNPTAYVEHYTNQRIQEAVREVEAQTRFRQIEDRQRAQHADFDEVSVLAQQAAMRDPKLAQRILTAADPGAELYSVGKQIKDYQELTTNPDAYREKVRQEILAEQAEQDGENAPAVTQISLPAIF